MPLLSGAVLGTANLRTRGVHQIEQRLNWISSVPCRWLVVLLVCLSNIRAVYQGHHELVRHKTIV